LGHTGSINDLKFLNNNGDLASCSSDHSIRIWDMSNTNEVKSINSEAHNKSCLSLSLLNNNNYLVSSSEDKTIKIWNTNLFYNISIINGYSSLDNNQSIVSSSQNKQPDNNSLINYSNLWKIEYCKNNSSLKCKNFLAKLNEILDDL